MRGLLGDSASSPPRDDSDTFSLSDDPGDQASIRRAIRLGQLDELQQGAAYNRKWITGLRYSNIGNSVDSVERYLHSLWYIYYQVGRSLSHESPEHDRWVLDVLRTRGRGPLTRRAPYSPGIDIARTPDGTIWNDLPFFVTDMTDFWLNDFAAMDASQRLNFSSFLAKLASTRLNRDKLCQIALLLFRETFETVQPLTRPNDSDGEDPCRSVMALSIAVLLPAACSWIHEAGHNIILLTDVSWNDCPRSIGQGGDTFVQSELGRRSPAGFSPWRWLYWLKRLHEILDEAEQASEKGLAEHAAEAIEVMLSNVEERNSEILRVSKAEGDALQQNKHFLGLKRLITKDQSGEEE